jgi:hypothetical protein
MIKYLLSFLGGFVLACLIVLLKIVSLAQQMPWWGERHYRQPVEEVCDVAARHT